jgi:hypothetical protein
LRKDAGNIATEIAIYVEEANIPQSHDPLKWWSINSHQFPEMSKAARKYLSGPPTSVDSERVFSESGAVADDQRSSLLPENFQSLVFLRCNLLKYGNDY